ncbi:replicative DNA helicase [Hymenobacter sp. H14-R3]|uniref:replicative DNA helicase n=1 Tax=Hymenobacter sp. H14-R3 TaxID=3046308 RepID=UPI0024B95DB0|nr:replicative DNA helicase [Hymenobacter sp. H14-R3]MDJ0367406.1 replicative DNA helicase [Hymenobacter sp. H14-R3]
MNVPIPKSTHLPPQALQFERAVLGAMLLEKPSVGQVLSQLPELAFYKAEHQLIYAAIQALATESQAVDQLTVVQYLKGKGTLERAGGMAYVAGLTMHVNSAANLDTHSRIILQQYMRRVMIEATTKAQAKAYDEGLDPLEVLAELQMQFTSLHQVIDQRPAQTVADHFDAVFAKLEADVLKPGLTGVPTGLTQLNDATGGWQPGDLVVIAARPAMGKTAVMLAQAREASLDHDKHTAIFSLEMPAAQLVQRLVSSEVEGYSNSDLRRGNIEGGAPEVASIREKAKRLKTLGHRLHIDDTPGLSIQQVRAKCARLHAEHPLGLVMVDYIQLMKGDQKSRGNREQEISSISRGLKELAKELMVPVVALSQLSRDVEKRGGQKRPQLSDLRESGAIEQDADIIMFLWRGEYYKIEEYEDGSPTEGTLLMDIAKNRNGSVGEIIVGCELKRGLLYDLGDAPASAELPPAAAEFQPRVIAVSTAGDFGQPAPFQKAPPDAPF